MAPDHRSLPTPSSPDPAARLDVELVANGAAALGPLREAPYWLIAVAFHVLILLVLGTILVIEPPEAMKEIRTIVSMPAPEPEYKPPLRRDLVAVPEIQDRPVREQERVVRVIQEPRATAPRFDLQPSPITPFGMFEGTPAADLAQGEDRGPEAGCLPGSSDAVEAALRWLARHQHPDGRWSSAGYQDSCDVAEHGAPCGFLPGISAPTAVDTGFAEFDVGVTALALLAFTGYGASTREGGDPEFRRAVQRGSEWLVGQQIRSDDPALDGLLGAPPEGSAEWVYNHAIGTLALCDLYSVSRDPIRFRRSSEAAVRWCLRAQNPGYGWKYGYRSGKNDTSVTGWMVLALRSARVCEMNRLLRFDEGELDAAVAGALSWIDAATSSATGITGYESPGDDGSRLLSVHGDPYPFAHRASCMTAVGVLCRLIGGEARRSDAVRLGVAHLEAHPPEWRPTHGKRYSTIHFYAWYYGSAALLQADGKGWEPWSEALRDALLPHQRVGGCADGSWDPLDEWGAAGGRVYSTALGALTLEVLGRFGDR